MKRTGHKDDYAHRTHGTSHTSSRTPLAEKERNTHSPQKGGQKGAPTKSSNASAVPSTGGAKKSTKGYATMRVKTNNLYKTKLTEVLLYERKREKDFQDFAADKKSLLTSYMSDSGRAPTVAELNESTGTASEYNMDYMNTFNASAFGSFVSLHVKVAFGEDPQSEPVDLLLDTGSSVLWVNKTVYNEALQKTNAKQGRLVGGRILKIRYAAGAIQGLLYKDTVTFSSSGVSVKKHVFGVVSEESNPNVKAWKEQRQVMGILGVGPRAANRDVVDNIKSHQKEDLPTIIDNLKDQGIISQKIIGIKFQFPNESGSDAGKLSAEIHFGGPKPGAYKHETLRKFPASTKQGVSSYYAVDLALKYNGESVMKSSAGVIDTGSIFVSFPADALQKYMEAVQRASGRQDPVIKYDEGLHLYHVAKRDFKLLKDLEFQFGSGSSSVFKFSPHAQVVPPLLMKQWTGSNSDEDLLLVFRKSNESGERKFTLGLHWIMWYYVILDASDQNRTIGIAEVEGHTNHKWTGLA